LGGLGILDIVPTVLYLMGQEIPNYLEGRIITEAISDGFLKENPPRYRDLNPTREIKEGQLSGEELIELEAELKNLGYI